jgi:tripartite-type tricarboxylate transporter receptor subunit TctC
MKRFTRTLAATLGSVALLAATGASAADYPDHTISFVVPFAAGGPTDTVARNLAQAMATNMGQGIVVENKGGAGGTIGTGFVARAPADGYTLLLMHAGFSTAPSLYKKPGYDPYTSFEPVGLVVDVPMTVLARSDFPPKDISELAAYVKANASKITLANAGIGAASHLCGVMLNEAFGVNLLTVPTRARRRP